MIVVADTSPLNYLIHIECASLLKPLYGQVLVPETVMAELLDPRAPSAIASWITKSREVIEVCALSSPPDESIEGLDIGERDAIQLAQERSADLILIDELRACRGPKMRIRNHRHPRYSHGGGPTRTGRYREHAATVDQRNEFSSGFKTARGPYPPRAKLPRHVTRNPGKGIL